MDGQPTNVLVRSLRLSDGPRLTRMDQAITGRNRSAWYEGKLKRALDDSDVRISLGAEVDGVLAGAVLGSLHYGEFGLPEPIAVLDTILVDPAYARRRVGTALLDQLLKNLSALGIERLRTEVAWDEHDLNRFLARRGFVPAPRLVLELDLRAAAAEREASAAVEEASRG
jgi:ribosomal protein S18 acetylase RimI-like enzyme